MRLSIDGTLHNIGSGWENTNLLVNAFIGKEGAFGAKACADFTRSVDNQYYSDWVLPSKQELQLIAQRLGDDGLDLMDGKYLSSTLFIDSGYEYEEGYWTIRANSGAESWIDNRMIYGGSCVRPVRIYEKLAAAGT